MNSHRIVEWGLLGALVAATAWTVSGLLAFVFAGSNMGPVGSLSWYLIESSDAVAETGMVVALVSLHLRQAHASGRLGMTGVAVAIAGTASLIASTVLWLVTETEGIFLDILFTSGALGVLLGFPLLGIATYRARVLPPWCGLLLVAWLVYFPLIFILVDYYGEARALFGLVWLAIAYALRPERHVSVVQVHAAASS